jgi:hypothetical protein
LDEDCTLVERIPDWLSYLKEKEEASSISDLIGASTGLKTGFPGQAVE